MVGGDATAALQLLSHLQGDALSVALLLPMPLRCDEEGVDRRPVISLWFPG